MYIFQIGTGWKWGSVLLTIWMCNSTCEPGQRLRISVVERKVLVVSWLNKPLCRIIKITLPDGKFQLNFENSVKVRGFVLRISADLQMFCYLIYNVFVMKITINTNRRYLSLWTVTTKRDTNWLLWGSANMRSKRKSAKN